MGGRASRPLLWRSWRSWTRGREKKITWPHNDRPSKNCPVTISCFYKQTTFIQIRQIHSPEVLTVCPRKVPLLNPQQQKEAKKRIVYHQPSWRNLVLGVNNLEGEQRLLNPNSWHEPLIVLVVFFWIRILNFMASDTIPLITGTIPYVST